MASASDRLERQTGWEKSEAWTAAAMIQVEKTLAKCELDVLCHVSRGGIQATQKARELGVT